MSSLSRSGVYSVVGEFLPLEEHRNVLPTSFLPNQPDGMGLHVKNLGAAHPTQPPIIETHFGRVAAKTSLGSDTRKTPSPSGEY